MYQYQIKSNKHKFDFTLESSEELQNGACFDIDGTLYSVYSRVRVVDRNKTSNARVVRVDLYVEEKR